MPVSAAVKQALTSDVPDAEFAQRIASGDHLAFEVLMRKHNRMLYRTAPSSAIPACCYRHPRSRCSPDVKPWPPGIRNPAAAEAMTSRSSAPRSVRSAKRWRPINSAPTAACLNPA